MGLNLTPKQRNSLMDRGIFPVTGEVSLSITRELFSWIVSNRPMKKKFTILINSSGGKPAGVHEFHAVTNTLGRDVRLRGIAFGECGSAAFGLLQCCDIRFAVDGCAFFIHNMTTSPRIDCRQYNPETVTALVEQTRRDEDELIALQCRRIGMERKTWNEIAMGGSGELLRPIYCAQARKLNFVDRVIPRFPVF